MTDEQRAAYLDVARKYRGTDAAAAILGLLPLYDDARGWQPIETAPRQKVILLWAVTSDDPPNWKMATGHCALAYDPPHEIEWTWDGYRLRSWDVNPTHWMPLPEPPEAKP
jgi:hypothetical protein